MDEQRFKEAQAQIEKLNHHVYIVLEMFDLDDCINPLDAINKGIADDDISLDDGWVSAALGCKSMDDMPLIAAEFLLADIKAGYYDLHNPEPLATP